MRAYAAWGSQLWTGHVRFNLLQREQYKLIKT